MYTSETVKEITGLSLLLTPKLSVPEAFQSEGLALSEGSSWTSGVQGV